MDTPFIARIKSLLWVWIGAGVLACVGIFIVGYLYLVAPPSSFPTNQLLTIEKGATLYEISQTLHEHNYIQSPLLFRMSVTLVGGERSIEAGHYSFEMPYTSVGIAQQLVAQRSSVKALTVTIPEGFSIQQIADRLEKTLPSFDRTTFLQEAQAYRGTLFPDTYKFAPGTSEKQIVRRMREIFRRRLQSVSDQIAASQYSQEEIVIMASLLEKEAETMEDRRKIADILWRRLERGMPLQVDAAFEKVNGKNSYELTTEDLQRDDPFNTYTNTGLPPHPINNPGLASIKAALNPTESEYWYYLSDRDGNLYYSETLKEHQRKKAIYVE